MAQRELYEIASLPGLDAIDPLRQVFTLFYTSESALNTRLKFIITDNFGQQAELDIAFDHDPGS